MAVVVMETKGNRYKVHRILPPEGEAFALPEMTNAELNTVGTVTSGSQSLGGSAPAISSASEADAATSTNPSPGAARSTASVSADSVAGNAQDVKGSVSDITPRLMDEKGRAYEERQNSMGRSFTELVAEQRRAANGAPLLVDERGRTTEERRAAEDDAKLRFGGGRESSSGGEKTTGERLSAILEILDKPKADTAAETVREPKVPDLAAESGQKAEAQRENLPRNAQTEDAVPAAAWEDVLRELRSKAEEERGRVNPALTETEQAEEQRILRKDFRRRSGFELGDPAKAKLTPHQIAVKEITEEHEAGRANHEIFPGLQSEADVVRLIQSGLAGNDGVAIYDEIRLAAKNKLGMKSGVSGALNRARGKGWIKYSRDGFFVDPSAADFLAAAGYDVDNVPFETWLGMAEEDGISLRQGEASIKRQAVDEEDKWVFERKKREREFERLLVVGHRMGSLS